MNRDFTTIERHFNQMKNQMWQDIIHIDNKWKYTENLKNALPRLIDLIHSENLNYIILSRGTEKTGINIKHPFTEIPYENLPLYDKKWHPSVSILSNGTSLYMIGALRIQLDDMNERPPLVINIYKELNDQFSKDLTYNTSAGIILYSKGKAISGTLDPQYYFQDIVKLDARRTNRKEGMQFFDIPFFGKSYNIRLSSLDTLEDKETTLDIALFSPNLSIKQRFTSIKNQFLLISIFCVILAMIISLFISKSISRPVQELGKAMTSLTKGHYSKVKPVNRATEINILFNDFNSMVERMQYNSSQQIALIQEITFLKTYNEQIVESIQEGIAIIDKTGHLNLMNRAFYDFCPNVKGIEIPHIREISFWDDNLERNLHLVKNQDIENFSYTSRNNEGRLFDIRLYPLRNTGYDRATDNSSILMLEDITAKEKMESQLLQVEKLNSLSILTAGVAHEINNPLGSIMANVENLHIDEDDMESRTSVQWIKREIRRIAAIIKGLLDFTGSNKVEQAESLQKNTWLSRVEHYMKYILKENPHIQFKNSAEVFKTISIIPDDELLQIMINLLNNAVQAMDKDGSIELLSEIKQIESDQFLILKVIDNGPGIHPENVNRVFDPFFTTKPVGKGTGLGLSIVYGLINKYHGSVNIDSNPDKGCTITLTIPTEKGEQNG